MLILNLIAFYWQIEGDVLTLNLPIQSPIERLSGLDPEIVRLNYNLATRQFSVNSDPVPFDNTYAESSYLTKAFTPVLDLMDTRRYWLVPPVPFLKLYSNVDNLEYSPPYLSADMQRHTKFRNQTPNISFTKNSLGERIVYYGDMEDFKSNERSTPPPPVEDGSL